MHYLKAGSGRPVVLLHDGASDSREWVGTLAALSHRYGLYAPDLIGYGLSDRAKSGYYLSDFIEFTPGFIQALGLDSHVLAGHSLRGRVCLKIAFLYPERRLTYCATARLTASENPVQGENQRLMSLDQRHIP